MIPTKFDYVKIPEEIFQRTLKDFRKEGQSYKESIAYWTGNYNNTTANINNVIFASDFTEFDNEQYCAKMPLSATLQIAEKIHDRKETLFAQVHSHPAEAFHSWVDNQHPISHRLGFFSIVVPYFGRYISKLSQCKIYEYQGKSKWSEYDSLLKPAKFEVLENV